LVGEPEGFIVEGKEGSLKEGENPTTWAKETQSKQKIL